MGLHVPRITINFDFKESSSFGELSLISLGYGLHQAWIYSSMFDKGGIFGSNVLQAGPFNDHLSLAYFVSILVYGVLLLVASALDTKLIRFFHSAAALGGAAALGALGTLMLLLPEDSFFTLGMIQALSGILTGAGSSVLLIAWGIMFARQDSASIVINGALSIAIGFGVYGLFLHQIPFPLGGVASALLPVCELALLLVLRTHVSLDFDNRRLAFQPLPINHARFVLRFGLPVFFLGVALGILRQTSIETILPGTGFEDQAILFLTACCAMVLIMVTFLALGGDERWHTFFRPLIPFIAVTAVFIPFAASDDGIWGTSIVLVGYMTFEALMWIFFAELAQRFRLSPIFVCGLGRGVMALAALGGSTLPLFGNALPFSASFGEAGVVFVVIIAMMLAYTLLPDEREMASIVTVDPRKAAAVHNISRTPLIVVNEGETLVAGQSPVAAKDAEEEGAPTQPLSTAGTEPATASTAAASLSMAEEVEPFEEPSTAPIASRPRMDFSRSIFAEEPSEEAPLPEESQIERDHFRERCEAVANTYLLSRRENEVMYYLARGYKSSFIQQQLYISEGTAKTHIRHIYRKLDIHSQQELIHLIDEVEL
ncbi:LuxR C-terminal-related transcriptional regulator [Adlercreutzia equolifaciens]|uniref:response regulator transcription factor n=1 Tax=Adlercreutzia equolifaciens TaxID=446660 RepID=UPI0023AE9D07|nr:LuxR family transcriptional regulator [Adlercreutzia equolifaciens]MDE8701975.1 LuxR C-terminal-related transcriptional regulator [Adlercreutzia equolifaciens]